jgi:hypothetical protein
LTATTTEYSTLSCGSVLTERMGQRCVQASPAGRHGYP